MNAPIKSPSASGSSPARGNGAGGSNGASADRADRPIDCPWFAIAQKQFDAICHLPSNWDSNGAPPPDPRVVRAGEELLASLCRAGKFSKPHINPTRDGGVQFHWERGARYFEVECLQNGGTEIFYQDKHAHWEEERAVEQDLLLSSALEFIHRVEAAE